jgi:5-methylcytosine-specific restriction enzyme subunit McrC
MAFGFEAGQIPIRNAWYLLLYAWNLAEWKDRTQAEVERAPNLLALLTDVLSWATERLARRQLGRAFCSRTEEIAGIRGRIDLGRSLKRASFSAQRAVCVFPELSIDTLRNRIIRSTLSRLATCDALAAGGTDESIRALRHKAILAAQLFAQARLIRVSSSDFSRLQWGRNDRPYRLPLAVCELVSRLQMPTEKSGDTTLLELAKDEIRFSDLFERFVRNFYRRHLSGCDVSIESLRWPDETANALMPGMLTDITISFATPPYRRQIIDTKYSHTAIVSGQYGKRQFKREDLFQLYAYLRTQEEVSIAHRGARGMLLYPTTALDLYERMQIQGHELAVATVDLAKPWEAVHTRLMDLVGP